MLSYLDTVQLLDKFDLGEISYDEIKDEFVKLKAACDLKLQKNVLQDIENRFVNKNEI